jgi:hypothetical protein
MMTASRRVRDSHDLDAMALALAAGDEGLVTALFRGGRMPAPRIVWQPESVDLGPTALRRLLEWWQGLAGGRPMPDLDELDPAGFRFVLGYVLVVEPVDGGADFVYRLAGAEISRHMNFDLTGHASSDIGGVHGTFAVVSYRAAMRRVAPLYVEIVPSPRISPQVKMLHRLALPFAGHDGAVARFLVATLPVEPAV